MREPMTENRLYGDRAELYDYIYHFKDYEKESERIRQLLLDEGINDGSSLLEAACGTGQFLVHLKKWYEVSGFDLSESMLALARRKLPNIELFHADLTTFSVPHPFDAVLCMFSSIGYVFPETQLRKAATALCKAVRTGGILLIEAWLNPSTFTPGLPSMQLYQDDDLKICRQTVSRRVGQRSVFDFHWLVARRDEGVEHIVDHHELHLYEPEEIIAALESVGFSVRGGEKGLGPERGLYVAKKED